MDPTIELVAIVIKSMMIEGSLTIKEADVMATRMIEGWSVRGVRIDNKAFYAECGLDINVVPEGERSK